MPETLMPETWEARRMADIRADFPILNREHNKQPLVYLDNAATTQKPQAVIDAVADYYSRHNANVHRAAHFLAAEATQMLEDARAATARFIHAASEREIIFTRGTTEALNLVAAILDTELKPGDEILLTTLEHHSNIVPWQMLAARTGAQIKAVSVLPDGDLDLDDFHAKLGARTRVFACNHVSNALGTINPVADLIRQARQAGAITVIDGAQAALHEEINVQQLDCDFYALSGHKMYAPTGIGALYGKLSLLQSLPPWQGGGEMIEKVTLSASTYQQPPYKYEAGTPNIAGAVGLHAAIKYLLHIDRAELIAAEDQLVKLAISRLQQIPGVQLVGDPRQRRAVVSFLMDGAHPHDVGTLLDQQGVAVRTGHHCAMPLMDHFGIPGTIRASFSLYNSEQDVERFVQGVEKAATFI